MEKELKQLETALNELHKSNDVTDAAYSTLNFALEQVKNCTIPVVTKSKNYPHCWGKMNWILKYESGKEPSSSICQCEFGSSKCLKLTRENAVNG